MNREIKERWVAALRSERYSQRQDALHRNGSFCCLGVLCDIIDPTRWVSRGEYNAQSWDGSVYFLPIEIGRLAELPSSDDSTSHLIDMNDSGIPFEGIADWIEENL